MATNRRHRVRVATLAPALSEWTRSEDADRFFRGQFDESYHGSAQLKELLRPKLWCCALRHLWDDYLEGRPDCGHPLHIADGRCAQQLEPLIELHNEWKKHQ